MSLVFFWFCFVPVIFFQASGLGLYRIFMLCKSLPFACLCFSVSIVLYLTVVFSQLRVEES